VADERVRRVLICTPDKDLAQCVRDPVAVQWDRRADVRYDEAAVVAKFGVPPAAIPDYLALVGDSADGFPGLRGWGAKSAATVLARYGSLDEIPDLPWDVTVRGAAALAATLTAERDTARLFRTLATLRTDADVGDVDDWRWTGPTDAFTAWTARMGAPRLLERATRLSTTRGA
jgi:5'-3' exonuclease